MAKYHKILTYEQLDELQNFVKSKEFNAIKQFYIFNERLESQAKRIKKFLAVQKDKSNSEFRDYKLEDITTNKMKVLGEI